MSETPNETTDSPGSIDRPASERYRLFATDRRRLTLDILAGQTTPVSLEELAAGVAAQEEGRDAVDEATIERVAITLHHMHLPKLAEVGVLNYDPESHRIDPGESLHSTQYEPPSPSPDELVAFVDQHRRLVLESLAQIERTTLEELSTEIASEDTQSVEAPAEAIATQLHHTHLPRLDDAGFIHYDPVDHIVEATARITEFLPNPTTDDADESKTA